MSLSKKGNNFYYEFDRWFDGKRIRGHRKTLNGFSASEAQAWADKRDKELTLIYSGVSKPVVTIGDCFRYYFEQKLSKSSKDIRSQVQSMANLVRLIGDLSVTDLRVAQSKITEANPDWSNATMRNQLAYVKAAVNFTMLMKHNSTENYGRLLVMPDVKNRRHVYINVEEFWEIASKIKDEETLGLAAILFHSGMRKGEALSLRREQIETDYFDLRAWQTKDSDPRLVPIHDNIREFLPLIPFERPWHYYNHRWEVARNMAGHPEVRLHDLRHSFASLILQHGGDLEDVRQLLGHATLTMTTRYAHLLTSRLKTTVNLIKGKS